MRGIYDIVLLLGCFACGAEDTPAPAAPRIFGAGSLSTTTFVETGIACTPDGQVCFVARHAGAWGRPDNPPSRIYEYRYRNENWTLVGPASFGATDTTYSDSDPFITPDGQAIYYVSNRPYPGKDGTGPDLWRAERTARGWRDPVPLIGVNGPGYEASPVTDAAGVLYFASMRDGGLGLGDLYRATPDAAGGFAPPERLPVPPNSPNGAWNLLVDPAGQWLLVEVSGREDAQSDYGDLYRCRRNATGWSELTSVSLVNTTGSELNPRPAPFGDSLLYISSGSRVSTDADIWIVSRAELGLLEYVPKKQ